MFYKKVDRHIVYDFISIKAGIKRLNKVNPPILFVRNKSKNFLGTVTDGDIRRYILRGENLTDKINTITNKNSYACNFNSLKSKKNILEKKLIDLSLKSIPVLKNKKIIGALFSVPQQRKQTPILIMAGGKGEDYCPLQVKYLNHW